MKEIFYNNNNLTKEDIDETVVRIKALLINSKNEILLGYSHSTYQFLGGHLEEGETLLETLKREVEEETGIILNINNIEPFFYIKHYSKNYRNTTKNRCNEIYYFIIHTDEHYNIDNTKYNDNEKEGNYELRYINLNDIEEVLKNSVIDEEINKMIVEEMLEVIKEYKRFKID